MREPRFYVDQPLAPGERVPLPASAGRHLRTVLRARPGAVLCLFNGRGGEYRARLADRGRDSVAEVEEFRDVEREAALRVTLLQGVARAPRMDLVIGKAVELGVYRLTPVLTERSTVRLDTARAAARLRHWRQVVIAACEQCGRNRLPPVTAPQALPEALATAATGLRLLLHGGATREPASYPPPREGVTLLLGPEGGLSPAEREFACGAGFRPASLGPRVLRTETAALAALSTCQALWGAAADDPAPPPAGKSKAPPPHHAGPLARGAVQ